MPKSGATTKERILDTAESLVLSHGFAGASIDKVIEGAGITKGTFFYHFKSKQELAKTLIERFHKKDMELFGQYMIKAEKVSSDPLQQLLLLVGFLEEMFGELSEPYPGCLFASYVYQSRQFDTETLAVCSRAMTDWRQMYSDKLRQTIDKYKPKHDVEVDELADMLTCILEGALLLSRTLQDPKLVAPQLAHYRNYLQLLFSGDE